MGDTELQKRLEAKSDAELVEVLVSEQYRPEARDLAAAVLRHRFPGLGAPAAAGAQALADAVVMALVERSARCHLCVSAPDIAERYPFLLCRRVVGRLDMALAVGDLALALGGVPLPSITWLRRAQYDVVPLMLNLCASCAQARRGEITKELCLENPLVGLLQRFGGFTEIQWPIELHDNQRSDGGPSRLKPGARVLTTAGVGVIQRVTPAGQAIIDLDAGGTVTQDVSRIVACPDEDPQRD